MDEEGPGPADGQVMVHMLLRLAPLVAAALAVPRLLDHFGVRDVSWAPPEYGLVAEAADPLPPRCVVRPVTPVPPRSRRLP